jgi:hypothetical protein
MYVAAPAKQEGVESGCEVLEKARIGQKRNKHGRPASLEHGC